MSEPTMRDVHNTMTRCIEKIDKVTGDITDIKTGLYGPLSAPGTGFIVETNTHIKSLDGKMKLLLTERDDRKKDKKWTLRAAITAMVGAVVALLKSFWVGGITSP